MSKRLLTLLSCLSILFLTVATGYGQSPVDGYKYILIPKKFDFLRKENQYRVNSQTKYLFEQSGFQTLLVGDNYPDDLKSNPCLGARANVIDESNSFTTKLRVSLTNCLDQVVYTSEQGTSKEKSYDKTYSQALKIAFVSVGELDYQYRPEQSMNPQASAPAAIPAAAVPVAEPDVPAPAAIPAAAVPAAAVPVAEPEVPVEKVASDTGTGAMTYSNENIAFFLIDQGDKLVAYVIRSESDTYEKGEMIGTFVKSSLPNVYRVEWKGMDKDIEQTTGYFDDKGNLKIDVKRNGKIEVLTFEKE